MAGQLGLERTPEEYVAKMVEGFREVRRVLRDDGTCWVNLGDSYATGTTAERQQSTTPGVGANNPLAQNSVARCGTPAGMKTKDLCGIPWSVAFAMRADGWYLRQDIIWAKPNPMPESVTDRCTKSHEYIFLLTKSARYWYDAEAIKEPFADSTLPRAGRANTGTAAPGQQPHAGICGPRLPGSYKGSLPGRKDGPGQDRRSDTDRIGGGANKRSVWTVSTNAFPEAHFATFPPEIPEICIKAGCPEGGTVLDPFCGAGTTGMVAKRLMRSFVGIELNPQYVEMARRRIVNDAPLFNEVSTFAQESHAEID